MIHQFFCYFGTLIIAIICFLLEKKSSQKETVKDIKSKEAIGRNQVNLIHHQA